MGIAGMSYSLVAYDPSNQPAWDQTVIAARNGHFMFQRGFMDYHADRFRDASFILLRGRKTVALLPAHVSDDNLVSHRGLSFGGWILSPDCLHADLERGFDLIKEEMKNRGLKRLIYSPSPYPYHREPCDDDLHILQQRGAKGDASRLAAFLPATATTKLKKSLLTKLRRGEARCPGAVEETVEIQTFWENLTRFLAERHQAEPVHSLEEIKLLKSRFPQNIRFFFFVRGKEILAGEVVFLSGNVLRFQYFFNFSEDSHAYLNFRLHEGIIRRKEFHRPWVDFGTSMDPQTGELQRDLHLHKENFGAHGVLLKTLVWEP